MTTNKTIYIGAGHGAGDPGAVANGYTEAGVACELRNLIAEKLRAANVSFLTDGSGSENRSLREAIMLARGCGPVRVELHLNAGPTTATGVECLSAASQRPIAQALADVIAFTLSIPKRGQNGWKAESESARGRLGFIRQAHGVIVELFFITNKTELEKYEQRKDALTDAIAKVLIEQSNGGDK